MAQVCVLEHDGNVPMQGALLSVQRQRASVCNMRSRMLVDRGARKSWGVHKSLRISFPQACLTLDPLLHACAIHEVSSALP